MSKTKKTPPALADLAVMVENLKSESDRAVALIVAAWLDDALTEILKSHLVQIAKLIEDMFSHNGPLGTFSARIKSAFLLGLFEKRVFDNFEIIRSIRNDFAHMRHDISFKTQSIAARCSNLILKGFEVVAVEENLLVPCARTAFIATGMVLIYFLLELYDGVSPTESPTQDRLNAFFKKVGEDVRGVRPVERTMTED